MLSQSSSLDPPSSLIKPQLFPTNQGLLQPRTNLHGLDGIRQFQRQLAVVQTGRDKLVALPHKRLLEAAVVMRRHLARDASRVVVIDKVCLRVRVDRQLALGADDLGGILLAVGHHAAAVVIGDLARVELDDAHGVVVVVVLFQVRLHGRDAVRGNGFGDDVVAEEPEGEVDVVHCHVHKHAAGPRGVFDEETGRVVFVARLTAQDGRAADPPLLGLFVRVAVRVVEAPGEAAHDFEVRAGAGCRDYGYALDGRKY